MRDDDEIKALITRLSRRHSSGGIVIERAAIMAEGQELRSEDLPEEITAGMPKSVT